MPYITKDQVKAKRAALKAALPQYKLSVTTEHYSGIKVAVMAGPTDFKTIEQKHGTDTQRSMTATHPYRIY